MTRTLVRGGTVYDGTQAPPRPADVLIEAGRIAAVGPGLDAPSAFVLDAEGLAVTPGFIDMHRHADVAALADADFGLIELAQGITAAAVGNCGLAPVPTSPAYRDAVYDFLFPVTGPVPPGMAFDRYGAYRDALSRIRPGINVGFFAGAGAIRTSIKGFSAAPLTPLELSEAARAVGDAMDEGAFGVTLGLLYPPECFALRDEMVAMLLPAAARGGLLCAHIRGEGDGLVASVREIIDIAERAGIRLNISHFKATGKRNWRRAIHEAIEIIERARARGLPVTVDYYPYPCGATTLQSLLPPCILGADNTATMHRLSTAEGKRALREAIYREHPGWDNAVLGIGWSRIAVGSTALPEHRAWQGRDIASLADENGYAEPSDLVCDLLASEDGRVGVVLASMDPEDVDTIARLPYAAVISDALYGGGDAPHPRLYGSFPRIVRDFVIGRGVLTLDEAIRKMTAMPAERLGLTDRGRLLPGAVADLCVFDPHVLRDPATFERPRQLSTGMRWVLLAGEAAYADGALMARHRGEVLRPNTARPVSQQR